MGLGRDLWAAAWLMAFCGVCFFATYVGFTFKPKKDLSECSRPIYLQLDLFCLFVPILGMVMVPTPFGMPLKKPAYHLICTIVPCVTMFFAYTFSTAWDNVIAKAGVWSYDKDCMVGTNKYLPMEEYAWFLLHTCLGQMVLTRMWAYRESDALPARPSVPGRCKDWRIWLGVFAMLACMPVGLTLLKTHSTLYLGVLLAFMPPVLAFQWGMFGHFFMWQPKYVFWPIFLESCYTIVLDSYAQAVGIWKIYPATGIIIPIKLFGLPGLQLEQVMVYSITSALVVLTLQPMLLATKAYYQWEVQRSFPAFFVSMICSDGMPKEAPGQLDALASPLYAGAVQATVREVVQPHQVIQHLASAPAPSGPGYQLATMGGQAVAMQPMSVQAAPVVQQFNVQAPQAAPPQPAPVQEVNLTSAVQLENEGNSLEQQGRKQEALAKYSTAIKFFEYVQKHTENPNVKNMIQERINSVASGACRLQLQI